MKQTIKDITNVMEAIAPEWEFQDPNLTDEPTGVKLRWKNGCGSTIELYIWLQWADNNIQLKDDALTSDMEWVRLLLSHNYKVRATLEPSRDFRFRKITGIRSDGQIKIEYQWCGSKSNIRVSKRAPAGHWRSMHRFGISSGMQAAIDWANALKGEWDVPEPYKFSSTSFKCNKQPYLGTYKIRSKVVSLDKLDTAAVLKIAALNKNVNVFSCDVASPYQSDVWFLVVVGMIDGGSACLIAVNNTSWYHVGGTKNLYVDATQKDLSLTKRDHDLVTAAISEWVGEMH
jgi:hypothetical protein